MRLRTSALALCAAVCVFAGVPKTEVRIDSSIGLEENRGQDRAANVDARSCIVDMLGEHGH